MSRNPGVLEAPDRPSEIDTAAQWLAGEGAGAWFSLQQLKGGLFFSKRFSPSGQLECSGELQTTLELNLSMPYTITYPSHCQMITLIQNDQSIVLTRIVD